MEKGSLYHVWVPDRYAVGFEKALGTTSAVKIVGEEEMSFADKATLMGMEWREEVGALEAQVAQVKSLYNRYDLTSLGGFRSLHIACRPTLNGGKTHYANTDEFYLDTIDFIDQSLGKLTKKQKRPARLQVIGESYQIVYNHCFSHLTPREMRVLISTYQLDGTTLSNDEIVRQEGVMSTQAIIASSLRKLGKFLAPPTQLSARKSRF